MRVLALAKNLDSLVISEVFRGVGDAAADSGYVSLIAATDGDRDREQQLVDMLRNGSVDGLPMALYKLRGDRFELVRTLF